MNEIKKTSYRLPRTNTLVNLSNSILKYFGAPTYNKSMLSIDRLLAKTDKRKVCLVLFDAMGKNVIESHKHDLPFIYPHVFREFKSVYPPTTVAATTSLTTGKYPIQTGYLGWSQYFKEYDAIINVFPSTYKMNHREKTPTPITSSLLKTDYIRDAINRANKSEVATNIMSFDHMDENGNLFDELKKYFDATNEVLKDHRFVYSYCTEPDHTMHLNGVKSKATKEVIGHLDEEFRRLVNKNLDTLFILVADHGMIDTKQYYINNDINILTTLAKPCLCVEPRFASFFVKDKKGFKNYYKKNLKKYFVIKTKNEILHEHTFGYGRMSRYAKMSLGDYFLLSKSDYCLNDGYGPDNLIANHAGVTQKETTLYLSVFNK